ncbi:MAG: hypothetical protein PHW73_02110 [Atribacterota bacterium]|nr:hypothetical protein [Atribacterota bacterium]
MKRSKQANATKDLLGNNLGAVEGNIEKSLANPFQKREDGLE